MSRGGIPPPPPLLVFSYRNLLFVSGGFRHAMLLTRSPSTAGLCHHTWTERQDAYLDSGVLTNVLSTVSHSTGQGLSEAQETNQLDKWCLVYLLFCVAWD